MLLKAAAVQPSVTNVVLTGSSYACLWPKPNVKANIGEDAWNEESLDKAFSLPPSDPLQPWHIYCASKVLQEKAAWNFFKEEKPGFVMNTILPNATFGPILDPAQPTSTFGMLKGLFESDWPKFANIAPRTLTFAPATL